jgi:hypothetical protein
MATKENKRQVRELVECLEQRIHRGPAIRCAEIQSARDFLRQNDFSPASDYFNRLVHIENRIQGRFPEVLRPRTKRNYGGKAGGYQMQVQSVFDHLILSTCYAGGFNTGRGRVKISHRFNQEGRIDFVELKYLQSLDPRLNGELRKLLMVRDYPSIQKDWHEAGAFVLEILPRELVFLYDGIFRCDRAQLFAWLMNIGHGIVEGLLKDLRSRKFKLFTAAAAGPGPNLGWPPQGWNQNGGSSTATNGNGNTVCVEPVQNGRGLASENGYAESSPQRPRNLDQLPLDALLQDDVAMPILKKAAVLESVVEEAGDTEAVVRYTRKIPY